MSCQQERFLKYHFGGTGIYRKGMALPLATGTYLHQALAAFLQGIEPKEAVQLATSAYREEVQKRGLSGQQDSLFTALEQCCLLEGLFWGWVKNLWPLVEAEFQIIDVEREEQLVLGCTCAGPTLEPAKHSQTCKGVVLISKPDFVARNRRSGRLSVHDFKTVSSLNPRAFDQYSSSLQFACGILGVEARLGEQVDSFYVHGMLKGGREVFSRGEKRSPQTRQYSPLCYARINPPNPPISMHTTWDLKGYWVDKQPIWEAEFSQKPAGQSNSEFWVEQLPKDVISGHFMLVGPFNRPDAIIDSCVQGMIGEEHQWLDRLWRLSRIEAPWNSQEFQRALAYEAPPSWNCYTYGSACQFVPICHRQPGWQDPLGSGAYEAREPLHPELEGKVKT